MTLDSRRRIALFLYTSRFISLFIFLTCLLFSAEFFVLFLKQGSRRRHLRKRNELSRSKSLEEIALETLEELSLLSKKLYEIVLETQETLEELAR